MTLDPKRLLPRAAAAALLATATVSLLAVPAAA